MPRTNRRFADRTFSTAAPGVCNQVYLTCIKKLMGSQLSLPHGTNKKLKCETKNKMMSVICPVQSRYREAVQYGKKIYGGKDLLKR